MTTGDLRLSALLFLLLLQALFLKSQFRSLLLVWIVLLFLVSHVRPISSYSCDQSNYNFRQ